MKIEKRVMKIKKNDENFGKCEKSREKGLENREIFGKLEKF